ncbi:MAG: hypothetical protein FD123_1500 [Bacteroidetes bacterium]|nr:MAG: hypothetical protein FD123_1500 [Bacteroidota bacterium]
MKPVMIALFALAALHTGCKKYEEGPSLSLRSKKARVANQWKVGAYYKNGADMTSDYRTGTASELMEFTKDGKYTFTATYTPAFGGGTSTDNGTWEFIHDKEELRTVSAVNASDVDTIHITRLKNQEFWHSFKLGADEYEIQMIPAQ